MSNSLLISVRFHDGRYHGAGHWPPSPARLFQALVAAAASPGLDDTKREVLKWLEELDAPTIAVPPMRTGQAVNLFVPNNDLDAKGGDIRRIAEIRSATKRIRPRLFDPSMPLLYVWRFDGGDTHAKYVCTIADSLCQLGRGVDMAWATAEVLDEAEAENRLADYQGAIYRPSKSGNGTVLDCPDDDSLKSLEDRYKAGTQRFHRVKDGRTVKTEFANAPKPRFRSVAYHSPATHLLFDIRRTTDTGLPLASWPLKKAATLVLKLRDSSVAKLTGRNLTKYFDVGAVNRVLIGRDATETDKALRVRIVPLPSIGHAQVDRSIRRVLVEVPPDCPIRIEDMAWAFSGLTIASHGIDARTGEITSDDYWMEQLVPASDNSMLKHYGVTEEPAARQWRSVTPLALPSARRRIDPAYVKEQAQDGGERQAENRSAIHAVMQALRHAGLCHRVVNVRVQREPFEAKGERAEAFADGTRFSSHQLWHVEIEFAATVNGPLLLGNGRYCGLGLMAPVRQVEGVLAFHIVEGLSADAEPLQLAHALRRAAMTRVQDEIGARQKLPVFFTGHEADGSTARRGKHTHLAFVPDLTHQRLLVIAPHVIEHREPSKEECLQLKILARALAGLTELRAGHAGKLRLKRAGINPDADPLFTASQVWVSATPYTPTRHAKRDGRDSLYDDARKEIQRRQLPIPQVVKKVSTGLLLRFAIAVPGPLLLGKTMHFGGGLFTCATKEHDHA